MKTPPLRLLCVLLVASLLTLAVGCAWSVGGSKTTSAPPAQPTVGAELIDLKKAHEAGAITDAEYEAAKQRILEQ